MAERTGFRLLLAEDDAQVARFVRRILKEAGFIVEVAADGDAALEAAARQAYQLIILDLLLPKRPGLEVLRELRRQSIMAPVLILTGKHEIQDKVAGLESGADDYLTKPFGQAELLARVRSLLRRPHALLPTVLRVADLELDVVRHKAKRKEVPLQLTNREYLLLEYLMRRPNELVTRTVLTEHVWETDFDPLSNVVDVHIARLRRKIDEGFTPPLLQTVRGSGYMLRPPASETAASRGRRRRPMNKL